MAPVASATWLLGPLVWAALSRRVAWLPFRWSSGGCLEPGSPACLLHVLGDGLWLLTPTIRLLHGKTFWIQVLSRTQVCTQMFTDTYYLPWLLPQSKPCIGVVCCSITSVFMIYCYLYLSRLFLWFPWCVFFMLVFFFFFPAGDLADFLLSLCASSPQLFVYLSFP